MNALRLTAWAAAGAAEGLAACFAAQFLSGRNRSAARLHKVFILCPLICGGVMAAAALLWEKMPLLLAFSALGAAAVHALTDLTDGYIYDSAVLVSFAAAAVLRWFWQGAGGLVSAFLGAAAGWLPLALVILLTRGGMGWGDAGMMAGVGALLGWKLILISLYFGVTAGGVCALILLLSGRVRRRDALPLAPFLAFGVCAALLCRYFPVQRFLGEVYF
jgi:leader peptidase (prepilin peptidase)/N-methyltransferase